MGGRASGNAGASQQDAFTGQGVSLTVANSNANRVADADTDANCDTHADCDSHGDAYTYSDGVCCA